MMTHGYNLSYLEREMGRISRILVRGQTGQKVKKTPARIAKPYVLMIHACNPSYKGGISGRITVQGQLQEKI
jgi:hypothetical protein